jgi:hypothetical protein
MSLLLRHEDVCASVTMADAIAAMEEAFREEGEGAVLLPPRTNDPSVEHVAAIDHHRWPGPPRWRAYGWCRIGAGNGCSSSEPFRQSWRRRCGGCCPNRPAGWLGAFATARAEGPFKTHAERLLKAVWRWKPFAMRSW